ncbi:MAG: glycogen/starch/alpha-glucan phosphorylase [Burkholderiaceae bacterium]|nr:glycogen/starch/alpha-glucan phosphorylase [Burkholderiaceae bacterium]
MPKTTTSATAPQAPAATPAALANDFRRVYARALAQRSDAPAEGALSAAAAEAARTLLAERWADTQAADAKRLKAKAPARRVHYLSMEFLMGRAMHNALAALGLDGDLPAALGKAAPSLQALVHHEPDAALGNGGLGRLAACFLDAFATLGLPSFGYGLRYEHGMFAQVIQDGRQVELPDEWLRNGNPWELLRPELRFPVGFGGMVVAEGGQRRWIPGEVILAQAYDFIVPGHATERVSTLRQWNAQPSHSIDFAAFCRGEHLAAAAHLLESERLNWVLYPDDSTPAGRELRLRQEYFLVSASVQDMLARHLRETGGDIHSFGRTNAVHLNDTHPALAPAELMRVLLDEQGLGWSEAWAITQQAVSYTNHTLMPEALETWSLPLFERLLPRHLEIVYEINARFLQQVRERFPHDEGRVARMSLIDEQGERRVRMAALAVVASHKVNGVSALHSELMVQTLFADYAALWPDRFTNVTNGVTPRRWLAQANPGLAGLLDKTIGAGWRGDLDELKKLAPKAAGKKLGADFLKVKRANKERLAAHIRRELGLAVDASSLFDVQIKRIHEYKRQLLNLLHVVARYQAIVANPNAAWQPRTVILAGKAASAYFAAKQIIQLAHDIARVVNSDPLVGDKLKLVYLPNYGVSLAETIIPAADLSEQISTAGTEASGTGNMKFALNGACTIGTWDGANIEMAQCMGEENMFVFGLRTEQVAAIKAAGYDPRLHVEENLQLKAVLDAIAGGAFSHHEPERYKGLVNNLLTRDPYLLLADFASYVAMQQQVDALYAQPAAWAERAIRNVAGMGFFSVDRTIRDYVAQVWAPPAR